MKKLVHKFH